LLHKKPFITNISHINRTHKVVLFKALPLRSLVYLFVISEKVFVLYSFLNIFKAFLFFDIVINSLKRIVREL